MKKKTTVALFAVWLVTLGSGFAQENKEIHPNVMAYEHADKYAKFKRKRELFHNKTDKQIKGQQLADNEAENAGKIKIEF